MSKWKPIDEMPLNSKNRIFRGCVDGKMRVFEGWKGAAGFWRCCTEPGRDPIIGAYHVDTPTEWKPIPEVNPRKPKKSKWVRVEDRKPKAGETVLLWPSNIVIAGYYSAPNDDYREVTYHRPVEVTHWRPLPKGPRTDD